MKRLSILIVAIVMAVMPLSAQKNPDLRYLPKQTPQRAEMILPQVKGYNIYKADFHVHTFYSDGDVSAKGRVTEAYYEGLDIIAITDHVEYRPYEQKMLRATRGYHKVVPEAKNNKISHKAADADGILADLNVPYEEAKKPAERLGMLAVPGVEITRHPDKVGHYNALFIKDANTIYDPDPAQSIRNAKKQGALITHNHPGWRRKTCDMTEFEKQAYAEGLIDGVEIMNGASFYPTAMQRCVDQKLYMLGCTDIHGLTDSYRNSGVFRTMTFIFAKENTSKAIRKALEKGMTLAYCVGNIAGDAKLLQDFFKASVSCKLLYRSSKGKTTYALTNSTSIAYKIKFGKYNLEIPPFQTITLGVGKGKDGKEKDLAFYVTNMWEAGYKNPKIVYKAMAK
jgi:hypothetical protein